MKQKLFNPVFLMLASIILPIAAFEAFVSANIVTGNTLFALFCIVMALIALRK